MTGADAPLSPENPQGQRELCTIVRHGTPFFDFVVFLVRRLEVYEDWDLVELWVLFEKGFVAVSYGLEW